MKKTIVRAVLCLGSMIPAQAVSFPPAADAVIRSSAPSQNFGGAALLTVDSESAVYLSFDLSALGVIARGTVQKAVLYLWVNRVTAPGTIEVENVCNAWSEGSLTHVNYPAVCGRNTKFALSAPGQFVAVDVTDIVRDWVTNTQPNYGVKLRSVGANVVFDSKENTLTGHEARLDVVLERGIGPSGPPGPQGPQGPVGPAGTIAATPVACSGQVLDGVASGGSPTCKCPPTNFLVTITAIQGTVNEAFVQSWPGGSIGLTSGSCTASVRAPSAEIDANRGDMPLGWVPSSGSWNRCTVLAQKPKCGSPLADSSLIDGYFPSCSAAASTVLSTADAYIFCN